MPMTEQGFQKYTYAQILESLITRAKDLFGDDIDTSNNAVMGKYLRLLTKGFAAQEEALEQVYLSRYIDTATGVSLDRLTPFANITRNNATAAVLTATVTNTGESAATIAMGTKVTSGAGTLYHFTEAYTIAAGGSTEVHLECDELGTVGNEYTIPLTFYNTQLEDLTITDVSIYTTGTDSETDAQLRARWKIALAGISSGTTDAIAGAVATCTGVEDVKVYENDTDDTDEDGIPAHGIWVIVKGDAMNTVEIAQAIFNKKPAGIQTYGAETVDITTNVGQVQTICFDFATPVNMEVVIVCYDASVAGASESRPEIAEEIFSNVEEYVNGLPIGATVYVSEMYKPIQDALSSMPVIDITLIYGTSSAYDYYCTMDKTEYPYLQALTVNATGNLKSRGE